MATKRRIPDPILSSTPLLIGLFLIPSFSCLYEAPVSESIFVLPEHKNSLCNFVQLLCCEANTAYASSSGSLKATLLSLGALAALLGSWASLLVTDSSLNAQLADAKLAPSRVEVRVFVWAHAASWPVFKLLHAGVWYESLSAGRYWRHWTHVVLLDDKPPFSMRPHLSATSSINVLVSAPWRQLVFGCAACSCRGHMMRDVSCLRGLLTEDAADSRWR